MPSMYLNCLRAAHMGTYLYSSISPSSKLGSIPQPELVCLSFLFSVFRVAALVSVVFLSLAETLILFHGHVVQGSEIRVDRP